MKGFIDFVVLKFHEGGPLVMSAILFVLIVSCIIIIERIYKYWFVYDLSNSSDFMAAVQKLVMNNSIENAIRLCKKYRPKLLPIVLAEGLKRANDTPEEIENALNQATLSALPRVTNLVPFLATTANVATLLGLLGTISGLIRSFGALANATGEQKQKILAAGISEALNATFFGLGTALICLFIYGILSMKQKHIVDNLNKNAARLLDLLYTRRMKIKGQKG